MTPGVGGSPAGGLRPAGGRPARRWCGLAALLGGLLCPLMPLLLRWRYGTGRPPDWVEAAARPLLDGAHQLVGASPNLEGYFGFGEMLFVVYLLALCGVLGAHDQPADGRTAGRLERTGTVALVAGLAGAALGNLGIYLAPDGSTPSLLIDVLGLGWYLEPLALLAVLAGSVLYGAGVLRSGNLPRWCGWALVAAGPAGALNTFFLMASYPRGTMLPISLAWAAIGLLLLVGAGGRPVPARPVATLAG
jgi:hypothetical protein